MTTVGGGGTIISTHSYYNVMYDGKAELMTNPLATDCILFFMLNRGKPSFSDVATGDGGRKEEGGGGVHGYQATQPPNHIGLMDLI